MSLKRVKCVAYSRRGGHGGRGGTTDGTIDVDNGQEDEVHSEISLNSVVGITSPKTFKVKGEVNGAPIVVMIRITL